jgi:hypothetical protein
MAPRPMGVTRMSVLPRDRKGTGIIQLHFLLSIGCTQGN